MLKNLKLLNHTSLQKMKSEKYVQELLSKSDIYGKSFEKTLETSDNLGTFMFHPNRGFKVYWNMFLGLCLLYTATFTPFLLAFVSDRSHDVWFFIDILLSSVYLADIIFTLNTAYVEFDGSIVIARKLIFFNYLRGWFIVDLIASVPFDLILSSIQPNVSRSSYNFLGKLIRLKNAPKLFRLSKLLVCFKNNHMFPFMQSWYYFFSFSSAAVKLLNTIMMIFISLHIFTCLWYYIARFYDFSPDTWIFRKDLQDASVLDAYVYSLYWAMVTLSTTGYGDITSKTRGELIISMFWMIVALYFLSFSISSLSTMISEKDSGKNRQVDKKLSLVDSYVSENNLPKKVKIKMQKRVKEVSEKHLFQFNTRETMLKEMPANIRMSIATSIHYGSLSLFPILRDREEKFIYTIIPLLKTENVSSGSTIYNEGNPCKDIYFIIHGKGYYMDRDGLKFKVISHGGYFGDIEVVHNIKRIFTVVLSEYSVLWVLTPDVFKIIMVEFTIFFKELKKETAKRFDLLIIELSEMKALQKAKVADIQDVGNIRALIDQEYKRLCQSYKLEQSEKNSISRIDRKLDLCKKLFMDNQVIIKEIEEKMKILHKIKEKEEI